MLLQIETNTRCNLSCWFCQNRHFPEPKNSVMPQWLYEKIVLQGLEIGFGHISHAAYNEPMADPLFMDRLEFLKRKGAVYIAYTNGTALSIERSVYMIRKGYDWATVFNLPAVDKETYKKAVGCDFNPARVVENIRFFARHSRTRHEIHVNGLNDEEHEKNFREVKKEFDDLPNCEVRKIRIISRAGQMAGTCQADFKGQDLVQLGVRKSDPIVGCASGKLMEMYVGVNGEVYLCCHDHEKRYIVGNVEQTPLKDIRDTSEYRDVLAQMQREFCSHCESAVYAKRASTSVRTRADLPHQLQPPHLAQGDGGQAKPPA